MIQIVLSIAGSILEPAEYLDQLRMEIGQPDLEDDLLGLFDHELFNVNLDLFDDLFDAGRMDSPIVHESLERYLRDFTPERIEP